MNSDYMIKKSNVHIALEVTMNVYTYLGLVNAKKEVERIEAMKELERVDAVNHDKDGKTIRMA